MNRIMKFGEIAEGYNIPVLNEREVRASAGILFLATFISLMYILFTENFIPFKYVITFFLIDFILRVFVNPKYSPTLIIGRLIVGNQTPEYVSAAPKKFAWQIGLLLAGTMFVYFIILNEYNAVTGFICLICLVFLFFESAFGICLGCKFYPLFFRKKTQYCPGDVCSNKPKQDIQKTSYGQLFVLTSFIFLIVFSVYFLNDTYSKKPFNVLESTNIESTK